MNGEWRVVLRISDYVVFLLTFHVSRLPFAVSGLVVQWIV